MKNTITLNDILNAGFELTNKYPIYKIEDFFDHCLVVVDPYADKEYSPAQIKAGDTWIRLGNDKTIKDIDMLYSEIYFSGNEDKPFQLNIYFFGDVTNETALCLGGIILMMLAPADWSMTKRERQEFVQYLIDNRRETEANND